MNAAAKTRIMMTREAAERRTRECVVTQSLFNREFYHPDSAVVDVDALVETHYFVLRTCCGYCVNGETCGTGRLGDFVGLKLNWFCVEPDASNVVHVTCVLSCERNKGTAARLSCNVAIS